MLLSHSRKFIFIHVYKNAGSSVHRALKPYAHFPKENILPLFGGKLGVWPYYRQFPPHITARDLKTRLPEGMFHGYFKFAVARNPWDWQVSLFYYIRSQPGHRLHAAFSAFPHFDAFIRWRVTQPMRLQTDFVLDADGRLLVDFLARFETIEEDFARIAQKIGVEAALPRANVGNRPPYQELYTPETAELVRCFAQKDIDYLGYQF